MDKQVVPRVKIPRSRFFLRTVLALALLGTAKIVVTSAETPPSSKVVSFKELLGHPKRYNGKRLSVRAYLVTSCMHCRELWVTVGAARDPHQHSNTVRNTIAFGDFASNGHLPQQLVRKIQNGQYDGYVEVTGIFRYVRETENNPFTGFGWRGLADKEITDITELKPMRPPIPAGIK